MTILFPLQLHVLNVSESVVLIFRDKMLPDLKQMWNVLIDCSSSFGY